MEKLIITIFIITSFFVHSQETSSFFDGKTFELQYFLVDDVRKDLDLVHPYD